MSKAKRYCHRFLNKQIGGDQVHQPVRERCPAKGVWRVEVKDKEVAGGFALIRGAAAVWECLGGCFKTRRGIWGFLGRRTAREIELCEFQQQTGVERSLKRNQKLKFSHIVIIDTYLQHQMAGCWFADVVGLVNVVAIVIVI